MTEDQFKAWKASPATKPFLAFLNEVREDLKERWASGEPLTKDEHAVAMVYGDVVKLEWADVAAFYGKEDEEKDNDSQK
ncbi:MAG: hypothetical protein ACPG4X_14650 [Pikeienuella sp.]